MAYSGNYTLQFPHKYRGDPSKVKFRSIWERQVFKWCELNPHIEWWSSEELCIPYICGTDRKQHRYFPDLVIKYTTGLIMVIEIKPHKLTSRPVLTPKKSKKTFINESLTYVKNSSKWSAAVLYCEKRGYHFQVWTEDTLESMGIKTLTSQRAKKRF